MDEYIEQLLAEMPDNQSTLHDVVKNILDEPIPEAVKKRLLKPLQSRKYRPSPPPRNKKERKRKAIEDEFDPIPRQKSLRYVKEYQDEILDLALKREGPDLLLDQDIYLLLDPDEDYVLHVDDTPVRFPDVRYVKKGRDIDREGIVEAVRGRIYDLRPTTSGPDITDEGKVYWVSYEDEERRVTKDLASVVLELLDPDTRYMLFTVVGRAACEPLASVTEELGHSEHRILGRIVNRGDRICAGALHGIDLQIWEKGREYLVFVRYELRPLPEQQGEPGPMFAPDITSDTINCVIRCIKDHFQNGMTKAGSGLTRNRRLILDRFDRKLADVGCTRDGLFALEAALKVKLVAVDALGNTLWDSGKYKTSSKVVVPCHNNHAWEFIPTDPPKVLRVCDLDYIAENALSVLTRTTEDQRVRVREVLIAFAARAIPKTVRVWLCGQNLMGSDGSLWRSRAADIAIDRAFEDETGWSPLDIPKELPKLEIEYHNATHSMGGAMAYRFRKWLDREEIKPTPDRYGDVWRAAQMEAKVWNSSDPSAGSSEHHHLDMRAAYLACEDSLRGGVGDTIDLVREYGFPTSIMRRANVKGAPLSDVLSLTGAVQLSAWRFGPDAHPYIVGRVGGHLRENRGWITTPELRDLLDAGDLMEVTLSEVVYSVGTKPSIRFPFDRDMAVRFVGKCARPAMNRASSCATPMRPPT